MCKYCQEMKNIMSNDEGFLYINSRELCYVPTKGKTLSKIIKGCPICLKKF